MFEQLAELMPVTHYELTEKLADFEARVAKLESLQPQPSEPQPSEAAPQAPAA